MAQIILDLGSGATCRNDWHIAKQMLDSIKEVDTGKHEVVIKWQLFNCLPPNTPLDRGVFVWARNYAKTLGYKTTSSVFDKNSLDFLLNFDISFVKIANRPELYWLIGEVPRRVPVYASIGEPTRLPEGWVNTILACVSRYPAKASDYQERYSDFWLYRAISDHTEGWELFRKYNPRILEKHFALPDSVGPDAGPFAARPKDLAEVL